MSKRIATALGAAAILVLCVWGLLFLMAKHVTQTEAQRIATEEVQRSAEELRFDASIFSGPELVDVKKWGYAFQWRFSDSKGAVEMLVWVDKYGGTEISWDGDLERLKRR